jgi:uncharacterized protein YbbC (DUF1343 family)
MKTGTDSLSEEIPRYLREGKNIALLCNQASVNSNLEHIADILLKKGVRIKYIFSPEHGLYGVFQDMVQVSEFNSYRGIPVISLYGDSIDSLSPPEYLLKEIDTVVVDLFDIGTRFYTFAATMLLFMRKASSKGIRFIICDRPNPIGGIQIEGNGVEEGFRSFVGITSIPVRHSLTIGELAILFRETEALDIEIKIIKLKNYDRKRYLDSYTKFFILPSPNMPSITTALVYPMGCLFEGTNISEGRGTTRPFEMFGADFIEPFSLAKELNKLHLRGVYFRPVYFMPMFHKFANRICGGIFVHITDRERFAPYITGISILHTIRRLYGEKLKWRTEPYEFVEDRLAIDLLFGTDKIRLMIDKQEQLRYIIEFVRQEENSFKKRIPHYYIYKAR